MLTDTDSIQSAVAKIIEEMADELELDLGDAIDPNTRLIADLGFASVDFIHLFVELESHFQCKMGFHELIMPDGKYVDDLAVSGLVAFIQRRQAGHLPSMPTRNFPRVSGPPRHASEPSLTREDVDRFLALMPSVEQWGRFPEPEKRNPPVVFVLSAPRSGSTLLRIILAGNPALFAPPELHLLYYSTMAQRHQALSNKWNEHLLSGTVRALMHLRSSSAEEVETFMRSCEGRHMPTQEFYRVLQQMLGPRLLVDKTPTYTYHPRVLQRAERDFESPLYLHLVRHPCGMMRSFEDAKFEQLVPFMRESGIARRRLAELTWLISNRNIAAFQATVPSERFFRIRYEDLVQKPEPVVRAICDFLKIPFVHEMLDPYNDQSERMTDGLKFAAEYSGDLKFHLHSRIEPDAAERWRNFDSEQSLSTLSRELAASFGYLDL